jgi:hypothetical protein
LILKEFLLKANDATVAADEESLRDLLDGDATGTKPGSFNRHAEGDAVTLAHGFCTSRGHGGQNGCLKLSVTRGILGI